MTFLKQPSLGPESMGRGQSAQDCPEDTFGIDLDRRCRWLCGEVMLDLEEEGLHGVQNLLEVPPLAGDDHYTHEALCSPRLRSQAAAPMLSLLVCP